MHVGDGFYQALVENMKNYITVAIKRVYTGIYDVSVYQQLIFNKYMDSPSNITVIFNPLRLILIIFTHTSFTKSHYSGFCACMHLMPCIL